MKTAAHILTFMALWYGLGCSTTLDHTPSAFDLEDPPPRFASAGPVSIQSAIARPQRFEIVLPVQSMTVSMQEYTDALVERIIRLLEDQGAAVVADSEPSAEVEVVYVNILPGAGSFQCVVDFTVRTGDGYVRGHQARHQSWSAEKACNAALSRAAYVFLSDVELMRRLTAGR
jgi:hypothetical protein